MPAAAPNATALRTVLIGATGRMGLALLQGAPAFPRLAMSAAIASPGSAAQGRDAAELAGLQPSGVRVSADLAAALADADVAIDFSTAGATRANLAACRAARVPLVLCATGYPPALETEFAAAAREIPLLVAPNTSVAVTLMTELVRVAARSLRGFDIDILDIHHRGKRDAPSGTALALGEAAREGRAAAGAQPDRAGGLPGREIAFESVRAGDAVGEHSVLFSGPGEQLSLTHRASDRSIYAAGALAAALWLASQPAGRYGMGDVLGLKQ